MIHMISTNLKSRKEAAADTTPPRRSSDEDSVIDLTQEKAISLAPEDADPAARSKTPTALPSAPFLTRSHRAWSKARRGRIQGRPSIRKREKTDLAATYATTSRRTSSGAGPSSADPRPRKGDKLSDFAKRAVDALLGATRVVEDLQETVTLHEERVAYRKVLKSYGIQASSPLESDDSDTAYESGWTAQHSPAPPPSPSTKKVSFDARSDHVTLGPESSGSSGDTVILTAPQSPMTGRNPAHLSFH